MGLASLKLDAVAQQTNFLLARAIVGPQAAMARAAAERAAVPLVELLRADSGWADVGWVLLAVGLLGPVAEEMYFRGVVYGGLRERWGPRWALAVSSVLFAAVHFRVIGFLSVLVGGLIAAFLYERTRSLLPPIMVHAIHNVAFVLGRAYGWPIF